jgi:hydroxymethylpyrimidine pyrophosphatase-like HAD family hydrolase/fructoselysine-6-P-deglycase FrlB-like protein
MGKRYNSELDSLQATYKFSRRQDITGLADFVSACRNYSLISVGSGGSVALAQYAAMLHEHFLQNAGRAGTPLDVANSRAVSTSAVLFLTAGGRHPDVLGSFRRVAEREPPALAVVCGSSHSPLETLVKRFSSAQYFPFPLPTGKDGFLATNSLLAFSVLLLRSWQASLAVGQTLPTWNRLDRRLGLDSFLHSCKRHARGVWHFDNFLVLHGPWGTPAALDFESRFHEAGIGSVQVADLRNFAHGRHYWLKRKGTRTCVIFFTSDDDAELTAKTLRLLPSEIAHLTVSVANSGPVSTIGLLVASMHLAGWAAAAQGIDPGRPSVPHFGRRIYRLNAWTRHPKLRPAVRDRILERKTGRTRVELDETPAGKEWQLSLESFLAKLKRARFGGVVCDYDGTVCAPEHRYTQPPPSMREVLNHILAAGLPLGVATGRGKSVRVALRATLEERYWNRVIVGYYNGSQVASLATEDSPTAGSPTGALQHFLGIMTKQSRLWRIIKVDERRDQLTVEARTPQHADEALRWIRHLVQISKLPVQAVQSTRSIDIIATDTSKQSVVRATSALAASKAPILCIGDAGDWPGNDFVLLANDFALSSAWTSPDPQTCWNLAPPGVRGSDATLLYLKSLKIRNRTARIDDKLLHV